MGMYFNSAKCDIYIGKGAGKKLLHDMGNAASSVKIVSPYLSASLIKELIRMHEKGISIELITTDEIEDFKNTNHKNITKLITQNRETDQIAVEKRKEIKKTSKILGYTILLFTISLAGSIYYFKNLKLALGLIGIIILYLIYKSYKSKFKNTRIYSYSYSKLFPFKVYMSPYKSNLSDTLIHGKIYLIDNQIAYLGSLNLTTMGTKYNYETRIRTVDVGVIKEINNELDELYYSSDIPERDIQYWGKQLYPEPIN